VEVKYHCFLHDLSDAKKWSSLVILLLTVSVTLTPKTEGDMSFGPIDGACDITRVISKVVRKGHFKNTGLIDDRLIHPF